MFLLVELLCAHALMTDGSLELGRRGRFPVMQPEGIDLQLAENIFGITAGTLKYNEEYIYELAQIVYISAPVQTKH